MLIVQQSLTVQQKPGVGLHRAICREDPRLCLSKPGQRLSVRVEAPHELTPLLCVQTCLILLAHPHSAASLDMTAKKDIKHSCSSGGATLAADCWAAGAQGHAAHENAVRLLVSREE